MPIHTQNNKHSAVREPTSTGVVYPLNAIELPSCTTVYVNPYPDHGVPAGGRNVHSPVRSHDVDDVAKDAATMRKTPHITA